VALVVGGLGVLRVWPPFAVVMSGSMAPTISTGDMVVLERLRAPARIGEIVAVDVPDSARARYGYPPVVIHRVFKITPDGQIRTKGDARPQPDPFTVPRTAVDTRVLARVPSGGRVLAFFQSAPGLLWLAFGGLLFFGLPLLDRQRDAHRREAEVTVELREQLAAITGDLACLHAEQERNRAAADATLSQIDRLARLVELACATEPGATATAAGVASATAAVDESDQALSASPPPSARDVRRADDTVTDDEPLTAPPASADRRPAAPATAANRAAVAPGASAVLVTAAPVAVLVLAPREAPPAFAGRWDAPPDPATAAPAGWSASLTPVAAARFSRRTRLVAASQA
jgi:signal peptidase I